MRCSERRRAVAVAIGARRPSSAVAMLRRMDGAVAELELLDHFARRYVLS
jgi:hypothetical protein